MNVQDQIKAYIHSQAEGKRADLQALHNLVLKQYPKIKCWFLDGKNSEGKVVSNPNIGYGSYLIRYADGTTKEFYQVGLSANTTGISVYIMGIADKQYLANAYGKTLGKATVTGYCIKFRQLGDINLQVLQQTMQFGFDYQQKA
ncbi:MAG: hypothetical protein JWQ27_367 [Ferruginibacter sp.]|nr:hypothetical protein [Ferruginibacter sp.]